MWPRIITTIITVFDNTKSLRFFQEIPGVWTFSRPWKSDEAFKVQALKSFGV